MTGATVTTTSPTGKGQVAWADTDASGWIHFTAALRWVEETEHAAYRELGLDPGRFPRKSVEVEYSFPFRAGMPYRVELEVERIGRTSLTWAWSIYHGEDTRKPAITGRVTAVHMGADGRPTELPTALAELQVEK